MTLWLGAFTTLRPFTMPLGLETVPLALLIVALGLTVPLGLTFPFSLTVPFGLTVPFALMLLFIALGVLIRLGTARTVCFAVLDDPTVVPLGPGIFPGTAIPEDPGVPAAPPTPPDATPAEPPAELPTPLADPPAP